MRIKICGLTRSDQTTAIAALAPDLLGFICVPQSPRYVDPLQIQAMVDPLPPALTTVGVFADASLAVVAHTVKTGGLTGIQLHGNESLDFCREIKQNFAQTEVIKALRVRNAADLDQALAYGAVVDTLLLDAYHPHQLGGTGETLDWAMVQGFQPPVPWFLAGGLKPDNVATALGQLTPQGVDVSSGVERSPGDKDSQRVAAFITAVRSLDFVG
ncbi:phosphoribosylanthranilate isomerase [Prochlorothrix hollandica]|uniref:N-(5'-phosphoribosyl)anthranilate isomerase n=1 Tax=Prochlorothrix hollandica PCC 9006 = CALU 1027 TaxID=317619 RepID=A0A0M2Q2W3_PROHO|nr:phosphoribosylanthranilate isomerase [Prochlorothrix hollandica]KKJ01598.1 N-(5'-phosphoribosyl)anthranilate isomerase [Prochlorothrix hollandica PCC 9006 = CALU 1027]